jgi:large repetitive protein
VEPITSPARVSVTGSLRTQAQKDVRLPLRKDGSVRPTQLRDRITLRSLEHGTRGVARLYGPTTTRSSRACTKANLVGSVDFKPRNGTFSTKGITVREPGYYTWVVTVSGPNGSTLTHGCGLAGETTRVSRPTYRPVRIDTGPISPEDEQALERGAFPSRITQGGVGLNATIVTSGVRSGAMLVPQSLSRVGWLRNSARIGDKIGTTIIAGHVSSLWDEPGALGKIHGLRTGQVVTVRGTDGKPRRYRITRRDTYARRAGIPERHFTTTGKHRLVMVTCTDQEQHADGTVTYSRNLVVTAEPVK